VKRAEVDKDTVTEADDDCENIEVDEELSIPECVLEKIADVVCETDDVEHAESVCVENLDVLALADMVKKTELVGVVVFVAIADFVKIPPEAVGRIVRVLEELTDTD